MIDPAEFVENPVWCIVTGKDRDWPPPWQHIARVADKKPLCGQRIKHLNVYELFGDGYLCPKCETMYVEGKPL